MTTSFRHRDSDQVHKPIADDFADETARLSGTFTVLDNEKFYRQLDDDSLWMLTDYTGPTFVQVSGAAFPDIETLSTAEMDASLVLAPDGAGGVEFRAEAGGGGGSGLHSIDDPTDAYWSGGDLGFDLEFDANTPSLPSGVGWVNQDSSTYTERGGAGTLARATQAGDHNYLLTRSLSGAPSTWLLTAKFSVVGGAGNFIDGGLVIRESGSGKFMSEVMRNYATVVIFKWDAPTTFNAAPVTLAVPTLQTFYLRIRKNSSSSFDFEESHDGLFWRTVTAAYNVGAYITPDEYGFEMLNGSGEAAGVSCHWMRLR